MPQIRTLQSLTPQIRSTVLSVASLRSFLRMWQGIRLFLLTMRISPSR